MRRPLVSSLLLLLLSLASPAGAQPAPAAPAAGAPGGAQALPAAAPAEPLTDARLAQAFTVWQQAAARGEEAAERRAREALQALQAEHQLGSLDTLAVGALRMAGERLAAGAGLQAMALGQAAVALAPDLPAAHLALSRIYLAADGTSPGRAVGAAWEAFRATWRRPVTARAAAANLGAVALGALVATAAVTVLALFLRRLRVYLHGFHHLLPRVAARWQSAALALVLLAVPAVLRLGLLPVLLTLALAVGLALSRPERAVVAALLALLGLVPWVGGELAAHTSFQGTVAEEVALLEDGGLGAEAVAAQVEARRQEGRASFAELFALGRFQARRGHTSQAVQAFQAASTLRSGDGRLMTNLANALLLSGNVEGAAQLYGEAAGAAGRLAAPLYNRALLRERRAVGLERLQAMRERDLAQQDRQEALAREPALSERAVPEQASLGRQLLPVPLPAAELEALARAPEASRRVAEQLAVLLAGTHAPLRAALGGGAGALLLLLLGLLARPLRAAQACEKCGGAVCRRCDRELPATSRLCSQCVSAFVQRSGLAPQQRARKQAEVARYRERQRQLASGLALLCSGAGHLFSGLPVRGVLCAFPFLAGLMALVFHRGLVRPPFGTLDTGLLLLVPLLPLLVLLHFVSVRGLKRRLSQEH